VDDGITVLKCDGLLGSRLTSPSDLLSAALRYSLREKLIKDQREGLQSRVLHHVQLRGVANILSLIAWLQARCACRT
jgi:hypothetical protein